ncbi:hypothetical protein LCGC14_1239370 [marine sediment metagenome]|uniref:Uncharacterized protein n=1 Tax=marine sediment metagenome TaxID=412755 RepID=A0A0F9LTH6_9ZZZZ
MTKPAGKVKLTKAKEHGVAEAVYSNGPFGFRPYMECLCGWGFSADSWEEVGGEFDDHLKESSK